MKTARFLVTALAALTLGNPAVAQQMPAPGGGGGGQGQTDRVEQLDQLLDLSDDQKEELRGLFDEMDKKVDSRREEAQQLQQKMGEHVGPDYDEKAIRKDAKKLGDLTADITAQSVILQSRVESVFTEEQRKKLEQKMKEQQEKMRKMRQQMRQQRGQGGGQGQGGGGGGMQPAP